jgi:hypothetical protein
MLIKAYNSNNRRSEIHREDEGLTVYLFEKRELFSYSIHYAESCAENYVNKTVETNKQFLTE